VLLLDAADDAADDAAGAEALGARCVEHRSLAERLATAVVDAMAAHRGDAAAAPARAVLDRTQRLIAAGEIALRMQHSLNNPLAAMLAESQLLEMEEMKPEHHDAIVRIVEQLRRVIAIVRQLDGVGRPGRRPPDTQPDARP
jgi:signal transduction histidine kinase